MPFNLNSLVQWGQTDKVSMAIPVDGSKPAGQGSGSSMPCLSFNHGSGQGDGPAIFLAEYAKTLRQAPLGVVVIEAHVEADPVELVGDHKLAARVSELLQQQGIATNVRSAGSRFMGHGAYDAERGFRHLGIPHVTISLRTGQQAAQHLAMGAAIAPLRHEGVLLLGSGLPSFHNFHVLLSKSESLRRDAIDKNSRFDAWLLETMSSDAQERWRRLCSWEAAPGAVTCHPAGEAEHFMPTLVIVGASQELPGRPVDDASHSLILPKMSQEFALRHFEFCP